ncbi:MAG: hypothetical protein IH617_00195 [Hydrogenophaga sp.]|nr:hypothetical protein [Hydrogenophaga sp.]
MAGLDAHGALMKSRDQNPASAHRFTPQAGSAANSVRAAREPHLEKSKSKNLQQWLQIHMLRFMLSSI